MNKNNDISKIIEISTRNGTIHLGYTHANKLLLDYPLRYVGENYVTGLSNAFIGREFVNKIIFHKSSLA